MIINEFNLGNTTIEIDNTYYAKTEEEKQAIYEEFNKIGCEILRMKGSEKNDRPDI